MARVTGIGGIFFRSKNPEQTRDWYRDHLGLVTDDYGSNFSWRQRSDQQVAYSQWSPFKAGTDYFDGEYMVNYRVDDLDGMLAQLRAAGVEIIGDIEVQDYGKFAHIRDGDGQMIELWQPDDREYEKILGDGITLS